MDYYNCPKEAKLAILVVLTQCVPLAQCAPSVDLWTGDKITAR